MKWFTFGQAQNVNAWRDSFTITKKAGHYVLVQAESVTEANNRFREFTGASLRGYEDYWEEDSHYPWEELGPHEVGTETPQICQMDFLEDPLPMLHQMGSFFITPTSDFQVNLYPSDGSPTTITYTKKDLTKANAVWRKAQPKLWAVMVNDNYVSNTIRVVQTDFDPNSYYDKTGNFGGEMIPEKEQSPKGWNYAYFSTEVKAKAEEYRDGAKRIFAAAVAGAIAEGKNLKGSSKEHRLGARRALKIIKRLK